MYSSQAKEPKISKSTTYLFSSIILGLLIGLNLHVLVEINLLRWASGQSKAVLFYGYCYLPLVFQAIIYITGVIGGYYFGRFWSHRLYLKDHPNKKNRAPGKDSIY